MDGNTKAAGAAEGSAPPLDDAALRRLPPPEADQRIPLERLKHIRVERLEYTVRGLSADLDEESSWIPTGTAKPIEVQS
jgi:hypothetical protein